jgi:hypothetical protein
LVALALIFAGLAMRCSDKYALVLYVGCIRKLSDYNSFDAFFKMMKMGFFACFVVVDETQKDFPIKSHQSKVTTQTKHMGIIFEELFAHILVT